MQSRVSDTPTAKDVAKSIAPVGEQDPLSKPIKALQDDGVAVLIDASRKPISILTPCDLDDLQRRIDGATAATRAKGLFEDKQVFVVAEDEPLEDVALEIRRRGLATGIAVVDSKERFVGYAFNRDVQRRLDEFVQQSEQQIKTKREQLTSEYPELRRRL